MTLHSQLSLAFSSTRHAGHLPRAWRQRFGIGRKRQVDLGSTGTKFFKGIIAACMPLAVASCGGSGGVAVQSLLNNSTNLEMTDEIEISRRIRIACSGIVCESGTGEGNYSLAYKHSEWFLPASDTGRTISTNIFGSTEGTYNRARLFGQHSGFYTIGFFRGNGSLYVGGWSAAFGRSSENEPPATARWTGNMAGFETRGGIKLNGRSTVTYSFDDNTVDVRLYGINGAGYRGNSEFNWQNVPVNNDGSFYHPGDNKSVYTNTRNRAGNTYIDGNFYGPNAEESAGVFERDFVSGGWLAGKE